MEHLNLSQSNLVTDEVNVDLDVLRAMMVDRTSCHIDSANIVTVHDGRRGNGRVELLEKLTKPTTLGLTWATALYLASALERETIVWRLEDQETRLSPRKTQ
jgi:hypothetical protein